MKCDVIAAGIVAAAKEVRRRGLCGEARRGHRRHSACMGGVHVCPNWPSPSAWSCDPTRLPASTWPACPALV